MNSPARPLPFVCLALLSAHAQPSSPVTTDTLRLRNAARGRFRIGAALNTDQFSGDDPTSATIVERHFDSLTFENAMKGEPLHPAQGHFAFDAADR